MANLNGNNGEIQKYIYNIEGPVSKDETIMPPLPYKRSVNMPSKSTKALKYCTSSIFHVINISQMAILVNIHYFIFMNLLASWLFQV